jgi:hypothetical protein
MREASLDEDADDGPRLRPSRVDREGLSGCSPSLLPTTPYPWSCPRHLRGSPSGRSTDGLSRSGLAFRAAGHSKALWIALPIVGMAFAVLGNPVGFLMGGAFGVVYLVERAGQRQEELASRRRAGTFRASRKCLIESTK